MRQITPPVRWIEPLETPAAGVVPSLSVEGRTGDRDRQLRGNEPPMTTTASPTQTADLTETAPTEAASATTTKAYDLSGAPTKHAGLLAWVAEVADLTQPDAIHWVTGSDEEYAVLTQGLIDAGTMVRLNEAKKPNSFWVRTDPSDVARVEQRTFICSTEEKDAGPTNNWMDPAQMKALMTELYRGSMRGRTMYVVPFSMGPLGSDKSHVGVEITDSPYVVVSMRIMTRMGTGALDVLGEEIGRAHV